MYYELVFFAASFLNNELIMYELTLQFILHSIIVCSRVSHLSN